MARLPFPLPRWLAAALVLAAAAGCREGRAAGPVDTAGLENAYPGQEALARAVLRGLEAGSRDSLEALLVTREEHRELLWPELPERTYFPFERARALNRRNTREGMSRALGRYGGRELRFVRLEAAHDTEAYEGFTLHRGVRLVVRDAGTGREGALGILDVVLEREGHWKLMNFEE